METVVVLGGAGAMATETVKDLVLTSSFDKIVVADTNIEKVRKLADSLNDKRLVVEQFDADDVSGMVKLIRESRVVANGLPRVFAKKAMEAAIEAKVDLADLISPHEDTLALNAKAVSAGISCVGGVGITPGITNILAQLGSDRLDSVDKIEIDFAAFRGIAYSPGLLHVILWEFDPDTTTRYNFENGKLVAYPPFSGARTVTFPEPIGRQTTYFVPHGESQTLSKNIPGVKDVSIRGCFPPEAMGLVRAMVDYGMYTQDPVTFDGKAIKMNDFIRHYLLNVPQGNETPNWGYSVQAEITGLKDGLKVMWRFVTTHPPQDTWGGKAAYSKNVALPLSVGAQMLAEGKVLKKGVDGIESMLPAQEFADKLRERGIAINEELVYLQ